MAAALALGGALLWGAGDFLGGLGSRRAHVLTVLAVSQLVGLAGVLAWVAAAGEPLPGRADLLAAAGAGAAGAVGLGALYRGLAVGAMGVVAPISAAAPLVPLAVDAAHGIVPRPGQWAGIVLVLAGIAVLAREPAGERPGRLGAGVGLALVAALGFGGFIVGIDAGADASVPWAVAAARATSSALAIASALAGAAPLRPPARLLPLLAAVGLFDTAANVCVASASTAGAAGIVAVLSALYPLTTVALARLLLGERLGAARRAGGAAALAGAALVAAA